MRSVPLYSRGCVFNDEGLLRYSGFYSFSECLLLCQLNDIIKNCQCSPYNVPSMINVTECTLADLTCLQNWAEKWQSVESLNIGLNKKIVSYQCQQCLPSCTNIRYNIQASYGYINAQVLSTNRYRNQKYIN